MDYSSLAHPDRLPIWIPASAGMTSLEDKWVKISPKEEKRLLKERFIMAHPASAYFSSNGLLATR